MKDSSVGVVRKAEQQAEALHRMGENRMDVIILKAEHNVSDHRLMKIRTRFALPGPLHLIEYFFFKRQLIERSIDLDGYDVIILRHSSTDPSLFKLFTQRDCIAEIQTMIIEELRSKIASAPYRPAAFLRRARLFMEQRLLYKALAKCKGMITVGHHLSSHYRSNIPQNIPVRVISNGYTNLRNENFGFNPYDGQTLNLLFVGSRPDVWHGLDRLVNSVFSGLAKGNVPKVVVHFVGGFSAKDVAGTEDYPDTFKFYGKLSREEINDLIPQMNLGIAPLALHRKGLNDTSAIKTVEYAFKGLPFVISYLDSGFDAVDPDNSFILQVASDESDIDILEIIRFADKMTQCRENMLKYMHSYAQNNLTWEAKLKEYLKFAEELTKGRVS